MLAAEIEFSLLHFEYRDGNETYTNSSEIGKGGESFAAGIQCTRDEAVLSCGHATVNWDNEGTTTISVTMLPW